MRWPLMESGTGSSDMRPRGTRFRSISARHAAKLAFCSLSSDGVYTVPLPDRISDSAVALTLLVKQRRRLYGPASGSHFRLCRYQFCRQTTTASLPSSSRIAFPTLPIPVLPSDNNFYAVPRGSHFRRCQPWIYFSAFSTWEIALLRMGMRQFLLLPNSTITSSSVISMSTP